MKISPEEIEEGKIIHVNKPLTWTSFQVVKKVRYLTRAKKVGHAGTLDPLADGVLIICLGKKATKQIESLQKLPKVYTGIIQLGSTTPSFDLETKVDQTFPLEGLTEQYILDAAKTFEGEILQTPPIYSAVKVDGERAYNLARDGQKPKINPKIVQIEKFELTKIDLPEVHFRVVCGKGTYIRSLARDLGEKLGNGGHLTKLRREAIGSYTYDTSLSIEDIEKNERNASS